MKINLFTFIPHKGHTQWEKREKEKEITSSLVHLACHKTVIMIVLWCDPCCISFFFHSLSVIAWYLFRENMSRDVKPLKISNKSGHLLWFDSDNTYTYAHTHRKRMVQFWYNNIRTICDKNRDEYLLCFRIRCCNSWVFLNQNGKSTPFWKGFLSLENEWIESNVIVPLFSQWFSVCVCFCVYVFILQLLQHFPKARQAS